MRSTNEEETVICYASQNTILNERLLGRLITIQDDGTVKVETIKF